MPALPILDRELFYTKLPNGSIRLLDWCLVNTELGAMVEPRQLNMASPIAPADAVDMTEASYSRISEINEDQFYSLTGTGGRQLSIKF